MAEWVKRINSCAVFITLVSLSSTLVRSYGAIGPLPFNMICELITGGLTW